MKFTNIAPHPFNLQRPETISRGLSHPSYQPRVYPQVIKYMGSKASILSFIGEGLKRIHYGDKPIVDLFAGACSLSGGFGHLAPIISNDIQKYSTTIASVYLFRAEKIGAFDIVKLAEPLVAKKRLELPKGLDYPVSCELKQFNAIEGRNQKLLERTFGFDYHLFTKFYSGTWWSAEQCLWIDSLREILDSLLSERKINDNDFNLGLTCLMHSMAYASQGTGHYAQYRDAKTESSMNDINKYRQASIPLLFKRKFDALIVWNHDNVTNLGHRLMAEDYKACLGTIPRSVVYADPPYAFVHYSRFYHAIETVVRYDYPDLQMKNGKVVKGRYRDERHQSPFCIRSQVSSAFGEMFDGVKNSGSDLVLSYSNTGMIGIEDLINLSIKKFGPNYKVWCEGIDHKHMTMGRRGDRSRGVKESLIIAQCR